MTLDELKDLADEEIQRLIEDFPEDLKQLAENVICYLGDYNEEMLPDGRKCQVWGRQTACCQNHISDGGSIIIYVGQIYKHCQEQEGDFLSFVRHVYMHELGHHLGIQSEHELKFRGL